MYYFLLELGVILLVAKLCGLFTRHIGIPQVAGEIIGGLLLGPSILNVFHTSDTIAIFAEIGVILLMFSTGLSTDIHKLIKTGPTAFIMACAGVIVPLISGYFLYGAFYGFGAVGSPEFYKAVFIGTIFTATSVSITVATLQELGKLNTEIGTTIVSAAIIDDVIGIIVLTCVIGAGTGNGVSISMVLLRTVLFFITCIIVGFITWKIMKWTNAHFPHTQRMAIFSLAFCLILSFVAENYFKIADITGAYIAGIVLSNLKDSDYIGTKMDISAYMIFAPVFFTNIGLKTNLAGMNSSLIVFSILFVIVALVSKVISCGLVAKISGFSWSDAVKAGVGMMTRGEVALIVAQKGVEANLVNPEFFSSVILLIIISSILTPMLLKMLFKSQK